MLRYPIILGFFLATLTTPVLAQTSLGDQLRSAATTADSLQTQLSSAQSQLSQSQAALVAAQTQITQLQGQLANAGGIKDSPSGTKCTATSPCQIILAPDVWTIIGGRVARNNVPDMSTGGVTLIESWQSALYQTAPNSATGVVGWWKWIGTGWTQVPGDPLAPPPVTPPPVTTSFFSGGGMSIATDVSRPFTQAEMNAIKTAGAKIIAISDDYAASCCVTNPRNTLAYASIKMAKAAGLKVYLRLRAPQLNDGMDPPSGYLAYITVWAQVAAADFGSAWVAISPWNEPGMSSAAVWHSFAAQAITAIHGVDPAFTVGLTPQHTTSGGTWDWYPDLVTWLPTLPSGNVVVDVHSYGPPTGGNTFFMTQCRFSWAPACGSVHWNSPGDAAAYQKDFARFTTLLAGKVPLIIGEEGCANAGAPSDADRLACMRDLANASKALGILATFQWNDRSGWMLENGSGVIMPWVASGAVLGK